MTTYTYKASDLSGKLVKGTLEAPDEHQAVSRIQDMGLIPMTIRQAGQPSAGFSALSVFKSLFSGTSAHDILMFTQDLSSLIKAGLPVDRALKTLGLVAEKGKMSAMIGDILKAVQSGSYLSDALAQHPQAFSEFYVNMIRAGEAGGVLEAVLHRLGIFMENARELRDEVLSALYYPAFIVFTSGVSMIVLMIYVIPKFSVLFADLGSAIPLSTRILLQFSEWFRLYWWAMILAGVSAVLFLLKYSRTQLGRKKLDALKLKSPIMGEMVRRVEVARFSRTLGTLMSSGVPILQALDLVKDIVVNKVVAQALTSVHESVKQGERLSMPLSRADVFPVLAVQMITVGEETGKLDEMLLRVAENYEKLVRQTVKRFISLLEPAMILMMGLLVGFIVISMLTAIFSINNMPF